MIGVAGLGVGLALAYAAKRSNLPPPREVMNDLFARIHAEYAGLSKAPPSAAKSDRRTRVERLLDEDLEEEEMEMGADYSYTASLYSSIGVASPGFPLPAPLAFRTLAFLDFTELTLLLPLNRSFASFVRAMRKDRAYLHGCAERGFGDGITGAVRGKIWQILCGADQLMTSMTSAKQGDRSLYWELLEQLQQHPSDQYEAARVNHEAILKDLHRTTIHRAAFLNDQDATEALSNVLNAYSLSDPEVGYTQGMNQTAAFLLTKMPQEEAYWTLHALMFSFKYDLRRFYLPDLRGLLIFKHQFNTLFQAFLPTLHAHFAANNVYSDVMTEWWMSCFAFRALPTDTLNRVWDWFLLDGVKTFHRVSLAILKLSEDTLLAYDFEGIVYYLKTLPDHGVLQPDLLMGTALTMTITNRMLRGQLDTTPQHCPSSQQAH